MHFLSDEPLSTLEDCPRDAKRVMVYFSMGADVVTGGIFAILSNYEQACRMKDVHGCEVVLCRYETLFPFSRTYSEFDNSVYLYDFEEVVAHFDRIEYLVIDFPMSVCEDFPVLFNSNLDFFRRIGFLRVNLFVGFPIEVAIGIVQRIKAYCHRLTMTFTHSGAAIDEFSHDCGVSTHLILTHEDERFFDSRTFEEKQDTVLVSPDVLDDERLAAASGIATREEREKVLLALEGTGLTLRVMNTGTPVPYLEFKEWLSESKWTVTLGEGLDGYFLDSVLSGGISFARFSQIVMPDHLENLQTVYPSYEKMAESISGDIERLSSEEEFNRYRKTQRDAISCQCDYEKYSDNLRRFFSEDYDCVPTEASCYFGGFRSKAAESLESRNHLGQFLNERGLTGFGVEVGAGNGDFSKVLLDSWKGECLYLVDVWCRIRGSKDDQAGVTDGQMMERARIALSKVIHFPQRYALMSLGSPYAASHFRDEFFDFVYIDACHEEDAVEADLSAWWPKLKPGGLFAGHEWKVEPIVWNDRTGHIVGNPVVRAVNKFAEGVQREVFVTDAAVEQKFGVSKLSWWFLK
jgi:hypothetical protein